MSNKKDKGGSALDLLELEDPEKELEEIGQARGDDGLTGRQRAFVRAMTEGQTAGNYTKSAEIAGYSKKTGAQIANRLMKLPHIVSAIEQAIRLEIGTTLTVQSIAYLARVLNDESAPQKLRAGIALKLAEGGGVFDRVKLEKAKQTGLTSDKNLLDMSRDELETLVRQGAAVLKAAAALPAAGPVLEGRLLGDGAQDRAQPEEPETE